MFFEAGAGDSILLTFNNILKDGSIGVTAKIYDVDNNQVGSTQTLAHVADGLYTVKYTVPTGYDILTVIYIPDGDDNATAIDQIKVRSLSPFGAGRSATAISEGINDDDIKAIIKAIKKELPKETDLSIVENKLDQLLSKPDIKIPKMDLTPINRNIDNKISGFKTLITKILPVVKIINSLNSKINKIDLSKVNSISQTISALTSEVRDAQRSMKLVQNEILDARNKLLDIKVPTGELEELILKADDVQKERFESFTLMFMGLIKDIVTELKKNNGNFDKTIRELESLKKTLSLFNLKNLQNEL